MIYVILLRGFNTGKIRVKKDELAQLVESLGFNQYQLILNTGNIIIQTNEDKDDVLDKVLERLSKHFNQEISGIIKTKEEITYYKNHIKDMNDNETHYVSFISSDIIEELKTVFNEHNSENTEKLFVIKDVLYWITPKGYTLKGFGNVVLSKKKYKTYVTTRNINTLIKIYEAMQHD